MLSLQAGEQNIGMINITIAKNAEGLLAGGFENKRLELNTTLMNQCR